MLSSGLKASDLALNPAKKRKSLLLYRGKLKSMSKKFCCYVVSTASFSTPKKISKSSLGRLF